MFKDYDKFRTSDPIITKALSKLWAFPRQNLVRTFGPVFTKAQPEFARAVQRRFTKRITNFLESLETPSEHAGARRYKDQRLDATLKQNF